MPVQVSYPGVYVQEQSSGVRTIAGVSTSIAMFVGVCSRGPMDQPTRIFSFTEYQREFGNDSSVSEMTDQVRQFFLNGGSQAYVMRIGSGGGSASGVLTNAGGDTLTFTARDIGEYGHNIRIELAHNGTSEFDLEIYREIETSSGTKKKLEIESFSELSMSTAEDAINQVSNLVTVAVSGPNRPDATGATPTELSGASNPDEPTLPNYEDAFAIIESNVDLFNLMILPRTGDDTSVRDSAYDKASAFCKKERAFLLVDAPDLADDEAANPWDTVNGAAGSLGIEDLRNGIVKDHSAVYWPRLTISDVSGADKTIDPSGSIAGVMARTDSARGIWKAPAGLEASILGVKGTSVPMSDAQNGILNPQAVNAIRSFPGGIVSWGARTMDGYDNSGNDDYKYVPVRRLALYIEESMYRGLQFAVFEPNDEPLWAQIRLAAGAFMNNLFRQGAFQGQKARDAYFVKCDSETTTQNDINLGIVNVVIGFAALKPAEFVVLTLTQKAGEVQV